MESLIINLLFPLPSSWWQSSTFDEFTVTSNFSNIISAFSCRFSFLILSGKPAISGYSRFKSFSQFTHVFINICQSRIKLTLILQRSVNKFKFCQFSWCFFRKCYSKIKKQVESYLVQIGYFSFIAKKIRLLRQMQKSPLKLRNNCINNCF